MGNAFSVGTYNKLPYFSDALASEKACVDRLMVLGEAIVAAGLSGRYGIVLLHRHFELQDGEYPARVNGEFASFSFPQANTATRRTPSAWKFNCELGHFEPIEFLLSAHDCSEDERTAGQLHAVLEPIFASFGLADTYGLADLASISVRGPQMEYELSHSGLRLSMQSHWRDKNHQNVEFSQSTWSFVERSGRVELDDRTKCNNCIICKVAPMESSEYQYDADIFGLQVGHGYVPGVVDSVDSVLLSRLEVAVGDRAKGIRSQPL